LKESIDLVFLF